MQLSPLLISVGLGVAVAFLAIVSLPALKRRAKRKYAARERKLEGGIAVDWTSDAQLTPEMVRLRQWMRDLVEPTYLFIGPEARGFSKLGGVPDLPEGVAWPRAESGPRQFLLQVDLAELPREDGEEWLPRLGRVYAFLNPVGRHAIDLVSALYTLDPAGTARETPEGVVEWPEKRVSFSRRRSAPSVWWLGDKAYALDLGTIDAQEEAAGATGASFAGMTHRVGGFPDEIQEQCLRLTCEQRFRQPQIDCGDWGLGKPYPAEADEASMDWRLLFQIDSDGDLDWNWGDGGMIYVFIRREDAKKGDFSKTVTEYQFY